MNPEDDPEARIRELEQPLADRAHASELGGGADYNYPPPPPGPVPPPASSGMAQPSSISPNLSPPSYGYESPFPGATPRSSSGMRWFWILAAVGVLGVLLLVGGIAAYAARQFSHGDLVVESPTETTSAVPTPGGRAPSVKTHAPSSGPSPSATAPAAQPVIVSGINENKTIACDGGISITVSGISNTVVLTGHCANVTVSGLQNIITVDSADEIDASGLNNKITYHSGSPKVSKLGNGNVV
ncbi:DUF3060 domain-containing protein, partial [Mycobacterium asiaticum]